MSENIDLPATEAQNRDPTEAPVLTGPDTNDVKQLGVANESHPLVEETGEEALKTQTESGAGEFLADFIYEEDSAWAREWLQNEETACVRAAKLLIRLSEEYSEGWLTRSMWVDAESGETIIPHNDDQQPLDAFDGNPSQLREIEIPRPIDDVLEASQNLGYDPTIVWDVYLDERKIVTEDNGIGMTPREFDEAFNTIFSSGSGVDGETGGMFGVGSESSALVHGKNGGGAEVETHSRRPGDHDGFRAYSYLGGANALPGEVDDDFRGTLFSMPVQESFNLDRLQGWVEDYTEQLRVPVLYREHNAGTTPVEEEYEASNFTEEYGEPPITIRRPGEFSLVAGPDVVDTGYHSDDENTFIVSMPIDRNSGHSMSTLWNVVIQIHDEQGRIVMGPNRSRYSDGDKVYRTSDKTVAVGDFHDDDVMLPQPTGSRDSLQKDSDSKDFFRYIESIVKERELEKVSAIVGRMKEADHPGQALLGEDDDWKIFMKMVSKHGPYRVTDRDNKFRKYIKDEDVFPDFDKKTLSQMFQLFEKVEDCQNGPGHSTSKRGRHEINLGSLLSEVAGKNVYMAASTGGKFTDRFRVLQNSNSDSRLIVISGASKYDEWNDAFGFGILKNVPVKQSDDHDFDVPDKIHQRAVKSKKKNKNDTSDKLKLRTDGDNSSIDCRLRLEQVKNRLNRDDGSFGSHNKLVVFTRGNGPNISDHYELADCAAIASVKKSEREELLNFDDVMTFREYKGWSKATEIPTEEGPMTPEELYEDDRMVILIHRISKDNEKVKSLYYSEELRSLYAKDVRDQISWAKILDDYDGSYKSNDIGNVDEEDKKDTLLAMASAKVQERALWAFNQFDGHIQESNIFGLKLESGYTTVDSPPCENIFGWTELDQSHRRYELMVDTPNWDNDSTVYNLFPTHHDDWKAQTLLGFHDIGIDPSEKDADELREIISK